MNKALRPFKFGGMRFSRTVPVRDWYRFPKSCFLIDDGIHVYSCCNKQNLTLMRKNLQYRHRHRIVIYRFRKDELE